MGIVCTASALAIVLLGSSDPRVMRDRVEVAGRLHRTHPGSALWVTGTPGEVRAARRAAPDICVEPEATNTAQNAVYMMHALPRATREVWVVTSDFHMPRAQAIFNYVWRNMPWNLLYVSAEHEDDEGAQAIHHYRSMEMVHASHWREDVETAHDANVHSAQARE